MHPVLNRNIFLVKEQAGIFKASSNYDIYDPESGEVILHCREDNLGIFTKIMRFTEYKQISPFDVQVRTPSGEPVLNVRRGFAFILSKVAVTDDAGQRLGGFQQKFFSIGGKFAVLGASGNKLCDLKGNWVGWDFKFVSGNNVLATVTKKWAGLGKELFTSADNYVLQISEDVPFDNPVRQLILAAVMCIDFVLKE